MLRHPPIMRRIRDADWVVKVLCIEFVALYDDADLGFEPFEKQRAAYAAPRHGSSNHAILLARPHGSFPKRWPSGSRAIVQRTYAGSEHEGSMHPDPSLLVGLGKQARHSCIGWCG